MEYVITYWPHVLILVALFLIFYALGFRRARLIAAEPKVCYWCEKGLGHEEIKISKYGLVVHHDCYLEELSKWEVPQPPEDL